MPNWCDNTVILNHDDSKMIHRAAKAFKRGEFLNEFIPVPTELKETTAGSYSNADKQAELELQALRNQQTYGYSNWYDFCIGEWGTKWDIGGQDDYCVRTDANSLVLRFQSAWSPPTDAYRKLEELGFKIDAKYYEPGMSFAGWYYDGYDDYYEFNGLSVDELEEKLPEELNEEFGITDSMREWESEREENDD